MPPGVSPVTPVAIASIQTELAAGGAEVASGAVTFDSHIDLVALTKAPDWIGEGFAGSKVLFDQLPAVLHIKESCGVVHHINGVVRLEDVTVTDCSEASSGTASEEEKRENGDDDGKELVHCLTPCLLFPRGISLFQFFLL